MTAAYYTDESVRLMKALKSDPAEFMKRCFDRVKQEVDRAKDMFIEDSWEKVRATCEAALFDQSHSWVAKDGTFTGASRTPFSRGPPSSTRAYG